MPQSPLLSGSTAAAVDSAFNSLAQTVLIQNARTLEDLVREMLRPMLKGWLDDNLPRGIADPNEFRRVWTDTLYRGGWVCASWPREYGGRGLTALQQVVLEGGDALASIDVNPLLVTDNGCVAVDALIVRRS